jgi:transposase-like protein
VSTKRLVTISALVAALAGGTVAAVAATNKDDAKKTEDAILADAAKRLNVSPDQLRDALSKAEDAQLDQAVKDGKLTQEQADEIKKHRAEEGRVLGIPPGGPHGFRGHFFGGPGMRGMGPGGPPGFGPGFGIGVDPMANVAKALGISQKELFKQLESGKSLSAIAKAHGKSLSDVEKAVKKAMADNLDKAVKDGKLTDKQRDETLKHMSLRLGHLGDLRFRIGPMGRPRFRGGRPPFIPGGPDEPGTSVAPAPAPSPQV